MPDSGIEQSNGLSNPSILVAGSSFCATSYQELDCSSAVSCENASDCPSNDEGCFVTSDPACTGLTSQSQTIVQQSSPTQAVPSPTPPYATACNLCSPNQVGINAAINFNGQLSDCSTAYSYMAVNYNEGEEYCYAAQQALGSTCCQDVEGTKTVSSPNAPLTPAIPSTPTVTTNSDSDSSPSSPTTVTVTVNLSQETAATTTDDSEETVELQYPPNTYFCGSSCKFCIYCLSFQHFICIALTFPPIILHRSSTSPHSGKRCLVLLHPMLIRI